MPESVPISRTRRRRWLRALCGAVGVSVTFAGTAQARPVLGVEVHWTAPPRCPGIADLQERVRRLLGREVMGPVGPESPVVEGTIVKAKLGYHLSLIVRQGGRSPVTRSFSSVSCESLTVAAAVAVTLLAQGESPLDEPTAQPSGTAPSSPGTPSSSAPNGGPQPSTAPSPPTAAPSPPASSGAGGAPAPASTAPPVVNAPANAGGAPVVTAGGASAPNEVTAAATAESSRVTPATSSEGSAEGVRARRAPWGLRLEVPMVLVDANTLPYAAFGLGGSAGARVKEVEVMLAGIYWWPQEHLEGNGLYSVHYRRATFELSGSRLWTYGPFEAGPWAALGLDYMTAQGSGPEVGGGPGKVLWLTAGLGAQGRWIVAPWLALFVRPRVTLNLSRPTVDIYATEYRYQVPIASVALDGGIAWEW